MRETILSQVRINTVLLPPSHQLQSRIQRIYRDFYLQLLIKLLSFPISVVYISSCQNKDFHTFSVSVSGSFSESHVPGLLFCRIHISSCFKQGIETFHLSIFTSGPAVIRNVNHFKLPLFPAKFSSVFLLIFFFLTSAP